MIIPANTLNCDTQYLINKPLFQREPRMDADKVSFLAGNELPDAALVKTLLVANGEQGVPAKLKEKGGAIARTCTCISNLHSTCTCMYNCVATTITITHQGGTRRGQC